MQPLEVNIKNVMESCKEVTGISHFGSYGTDFSDNEQILSSVLFIAKASARSKNIN
jgi:hypothetical protein